MDDAVPVGQGVQRKGGNGTETAAESPGSGRVGDELMKWPRKGKDPGGEKAGMK